MKHTSFVVCLLFLCVAMPARAQSRSVVLPVPDAIARGLGVLEAVTGRDLLAPLGPMNTPRFGSDGQWLLGGASSLLLAGEHHQLGSYRQTAMAIDVRLLAGRFAVRNVLLGLTGGLKTQMSEREGTPAMGHVGPMAGLNVRLHDYASLMPVLALTYDSWRRPASMAARHHILNVGVDVTFVMQLSAHLALSFAPFCKQSVYHGLSGDSASEADADRPTWDTAFGVKVGLLGWL